jgi:hypothetical protein
MVDEVKEAFDVEGEGSCWIAEVACGFDIMNECEGCVCGELPGCAPNCMAETSLWMLM